MFASIFQYSQRETQKSYESLDMDLLPEESIETIETSEERILRMSLHIFSIILI
jgi:hypothetical protein